MFFKIAVIEENLLFYGLSVLEYLAADLSVPIAPDLLDSPRLLHGLNSHQLDVVQRSRQRHQASRLSVPQTEVHLRLLKGQPQGSKVHEFTRKLPENLHTGKTY